MDNRVLISAVCIVIAIISTPLILRKIWPNALYGFRTPLTLSKPEIWYPANVFAGWAMLIAAATGIGLIWLTPASFGSLRWFPIAALLIPLFVAVVSSFIHLRRYR